MKACKFYMVVDAVDVSRGLVWGYLGNFYCQVRLGSWRPSRRVRPGDTLACVSRGYGEYSAFGFATSDGVEV